MRGNEDDWSRSPGSQAAITHPQRRKWREQQHAGVAPAAAWPAMVTQPRETWLYLTNTFVLALPSQHFCLGSN